jgi:hypothetical protein
MNIMKYAQRLRSLAMLGLLIVLFYPNASFGYPTADSLQFPLDNYLSKKGENYFGRKDYVEIGKWHLGDDVDAKAGNNIYASGNGIVRHAAYHAPKYDANGKLITRNYGGMYIVEHNVNGEKICALYVHMNFATFTKSVGQEVTKGEYLGQVGTQQQNGGYPEHFHFGIRKGEYPANPNEYKYGDWIFSGYTYNESVLNDWYDPSDFITAHQSTIELVGKYPDSSLNQPILTCYNNISGNKGIPASNKGGPVYVHDWYGITIQDFTESGYGDDGRYAIIYNPNTNTAHPLVWGFWGLYKPGQFSVSNGNVTLTDFLGPRDLGAPTMSEQDLPGDSNITYQEFEKGYFYFNKKLTMFRIEWKSPNAPSGFQNDTSYYLSPNWNHSVSAGEGTIISKTLVTTLTAVKKSIGLTSVSAKNRARLSAVRPQTQEPVMLNWTIENKPAGGSIVLAYSLDNGATFTGITVVPIDATSMEWMPPFSYGTHFWIKLTVRDAQFMDVEMKAGEYVYGSLEPTPTPIPTPTFTPTPNPTIPNPPVILTELVQLTGWSLEKPVIEGISDSVLSLCLRNNHDQTVQLVCVKAETRCDRYPLTPLLWVPWEEKKGILSIAPGKSIWLHQPFGSKIVQHVGYEDRFVYVQVLFYPSYEWRELSLSGVPPLSFVVEPAPTPTNTLTPTNTSTGTLTPTNTPTTTPIPTPTVTPTPAIPGVIFFADFESSNPFIEEDHWDQVLYPNGTADLKVADGAGINNSCGLVLSNDSARINYNVQTKTTGNIPLVNGRAYEVVFYARVSDGGHTFIQFCREIDPWTSYGGDKYFILTPSWQKYFYQFTAVNSPELEPALNRFTFMWGDCAGSLYLDDITVKEIQNIAPTPAPTIPPVVSTPTPTVTSTPLPPVSQTSFLKNGSFEDSSSAALGWELGLDKEGAQADMQVVSGYNGNGVVIDNQKQLAEEWGVQLRQLGANIQLNKRYALSAKIKAENAPANIYFTVARHVDPYDDFGLYQLVQAGSTWQEYSFAFIAKSNSLPELDIKDVRIGLYFGQAAGKVWVDDVKLEELPSPKYTSLLINGDFEGQAGIIDWKMENHINNPPMYLQTNGGADDSQCAVIDNRQINDWYFRVGACQANVALQNGKRYFASAYLKADVSGSEVAMTVCREAPPWNNFGLEQHFTITNSWQKYSFSFTAINNPELDQPNANFKIWSGWMQSKLYIDNAELREE